MGMTVFLGFGVATLLRSQQTTVSRLKDAASMYQIAKRLEEAAGRPDVLIFSALHGKTAGSKELQKCLGQGNGAPCTLVQASKQKGLELILPVATSDAGNSAQRDKNTIAGTQDFPVSYTLDGQKCSNTAQPSAACVLKAYAYFWASCPADLRQVPTFTGGSGGFSGECAQADAIHVRIHVVYEPTGAPSHLSGYQLPSVPADAVFYTNVASKTMSATGAISTSTSLIPLPASTSFVCPVNYILTQVADGKPTCACLYPFEELKSAFTTICISHEQKCGFNTRYRGTDAKGNIICQPITCTVQNLGSSCGIGGWIQKVSYTGCAPDTCVFGQDGGGCSTQITCTGSVVCCYDTSAP